MQDAEDALQETLLAAWRGLAGFEERASVRSWLYRIATNRCLNARRAARRRLRRARAALAAERAERPPAGRPDDATERELARRFATAFEADDVEAVVALLTDDAWLTMPPAPHRYRGPDAIAAFLRSSTGWRPDRRFRLVPTRANTQPAFGVYLPDGRPDSDGPAAAGLIVLTVAGDRIVAVTRFLDSGVLPYFGLPG